jgi:NhaA family Na+:H+ antiporter
MVLTKLFTDFFNSERAGGIVLMVCTLVSLTVANVYPDYLKIWHIDLAGHHIVHWINDGLMAIFFLLIGLELEREIYIGELSSFKNAMLPTFAALGGMVLPASIYILFNYSNSNISGFGIPMATDIAFALGVLSLLGNKVPASLKIFLTALAVIDDLGAIVIIAAFYTNNISWPDLLIAIGIFIFLLALNRLKVHVLWPYLVSGFAMWYFMLHSGVHATITGVLLAFALPFGKGDESSPSYKLQHFLHKPVAFIILPLFALANTAILLGNDFYVALGSSVSLGIMAGLLIGKPVGIVLFSYAAVKLKLSSFADDIGFKLILATAFLGGIGFTMSIFISLLAFRNEVLINQSKVAVIIVSIIAGFIGYIMLHGLLKEKKIGS